MNKCQMIFCTFFKELKCRTVIMIFSTLLLISCENLSDPSNHFSSSAQNPQHISKINNSENNLKNRELKQRQIENKLRIAYLSAPDDSEILVQYANFLRRHGKDRSSYEILRRAYEKHPEDYQIASEFSRSAIKVGKLKQADKVLDRIRAQNQENWKDIVAKGVILAHRGDHNKALDLFQNAYAIAPGESIVLNNLALSFVLNKQPGKAESLLRKALQNDPDNSTLKQNLALIVGIQGRFDELQTISSDTMPQQVAESNVAYLRNMVGSDNPYSIPPQPLSLGWDNTVTSLADKFTGTH